MFTKKGYGCLRSNKTIKTRSVGWDLEGEGEGEGKGEMDDETTKPRRFWKIEEMAGKGYERRRTMTDKQSSGGLRKSSRCSREWVSYYVRSMGEIENSYFYWVSRVGRDRSCKESGRIMKRVSLCLGKVGKRSSLAVRLHCCLCVLFLRAVFVHWDRKKIDWVQLLAWCWHSLYEHLLKPAAFWHTTIRAVSINGLDEDVNRITCLSETNFWTLNIYRIRGFGWSSFQKWKLMKPSCNGHENIKLFLRVRETSGKTSLSACLCREIKQKSRRQSTFLWHFSMSITWRNWGSTLHGVLIRAVRM